MSQRYRIGKNKNQSKNTRLPVAEDFANYRFNRDEIAHMFRYLFVSERIIGEAGRFGSPQDILDIGCGDIYIARTLQSSYVVKKAKVVKKYVGFDIDDVILRRAEKTKPKSFDISLVCGDVTTGGLKRFKNNEFDFVVCLETIEHIQPEYVSVLLKEIKRVGNRAIISTPNFDGGTGKIPDDHIKEWRYGELKSEIEKAGIKVINEIGVFSNINEVKKIAKTNKNIADLYRFLESKVDSNLMSIIMAKFIGKRSQNILWECLL